MRSGDRIGHLVIERDLGAGGMGEVFLAFDERLERQVAVKLLPADRALDRTARLRMLREARSASALSHPGIVTVYEVGEHEGRTFIVMEFVEGETLDSLIRRRGRLTPAEAVGLLAQFGDAVSAAHEAGVLHRDLKPANLMIDARGRVKVLDFGLAKRQSTPQSGPQVVPSEGRSLTISEHSATDTVDANSPTDRRVPSDEELIRATTRTAVAREHSAAGEVITAYGTWLGTPGYTPIEIDNGAEADVRSDVFSLGVVLYKMLTGELPFPQRTWADLRTAMLADEFPPASKVAGVNASRLDSVLARALSNRREKRQESVAALVAAARAASGTPATRRRAAPIAAAVVGVTVIGATGWWWTSARGRDRSDAMRTGPSTTPADAAAGRAPPRGDRARISQLTHTGGCAYAPVFVDDHTLVYDLAKDGKGDVYRIDGDGGAPVQVTTAATVEYRAAPGARLGEIVYVVADDGNDLRIAALDLADPAKERQLATIATSSVVAAGGAYYFPDTYGREIRRLVDGRDERFMALSVEQSPDALIADRQGRQLAFISRSDTGVSALCIVDIAAAGVTCAATKVDNARPSFSPAGDAVYAAGRNTIVRHDLLTGTDDVIVEDVGPAGGLAVSPTGDRMVFSKCSSQSPMFEVTSGEPRAVTQFRATDAPTAGPGGVLAFVAPAAGGGDTLFVLAADGSSRELVSNDRARITQLAFSADGARIAYVRRDPDVSGSGIYEVRTTGGQPTGGQPLQITDGAFDEAPVFLDDQTLLFNRPDVDQTPRAFLIARDGTDLKRAPGTARLPIALGRDGRRVLAWSSDRTSLLWWDPRTGATTRGPRPAFPFVEVGVSPGGAWIAYLTRWDGGEIWRAPIAEADRPKRLAKFPQGVSTHGLTVSDDGRVFVDASVWLGELFMLPAVDRPF